MERTYCDNAPIADVRVPLGVSFIVVVFAGVASWAILLAGLYFAWNVLRAFFG